MNRIKKILRWLSLIEVIVIILFLASTACGENFKFSSKIKMTSSAAEASFNDKGHLEITSKENDQGKTVLNADTKDGWDMKEYQALELTVYNPSEIMVMPTVEVNNTKKAVPSWANGVEDSIYLKPGERKKMLVYFYLPDRIKDKGFLTYKNAKSGPNAMPQWWKGVDPGAIGKITLGSLNLTGKEKTEKSRYIVEKIRPIKYYKYFNYPAKISLPYVDIYGQFKQGNWPGKLKNTEEFKSRIAEEEKDFAAHPGPKDWTKWGGWKNGPKHESTGYFYVKQVDGKWWFIDPDGYLFWSHGATGVGGYNGGATPVNDREEYYEDLPGEDSPFHQFYGQSGNERLYNFTGANLFRKYGDDWKEKNIDTAHKRLKSWGMNSMGNWSEWEARSKERTHFTVAVHYGARKIDDKFPDVWDESFHKGIEGTLVYQKENHNVDSPWNIGFFIDNELHWKDAKHFVEQVISKGSGQQAKIFFMEQLKEKYGEIEKLNKAWKTSYESWDDFLDNRTKVPYRKMRRDTKAFYAAMVDKYCM